ncbi:MAG: hypothetical protein V2A73_02290 [Pseudomonadota bacterium]
MNEVLFHAKGGRTAKLDATELPRMGAFCHGLLMSSIGPLKDTPSRPSWIRRLLPEGCYVGQRESQLFFQDVDIYLHVDHQGLAVEGQLVTGFVLALNTALVSGNDVVKLMARLYGQAEIHAFVEGVNCPWFVRIVEEGCDKAILRRDSGWDDVLSLLRDVDGPVVTSCSGLAGFPDPSILPYDHPLAGERAFVDALPTERWDACLAVLRDPSTAGVLELRPENWAEFRFDCGLSGFDLYVYAMRSLQA